MCSTISKYSKDTQMKHVRAWPWSTMLGLSIKAFFLPVVMEWEQAVLL
jgi:hypothetical protein